MENYSLVYGNTKVFAVLLKDNSVSVQAFINTDANVVRNLYDEKIYKTNDLQGAVNYYIKTYLKDKLKGE